MNNTTAQLELNHCFYRTENNEIWFDTENNILFISGIDPKGKPINDNYDLLDLHWVGYVTHRDAGVWYTYFSVTSKDEKGELKITDYPTFERPFDSNDPNYNFHGHKQPIMTFLQNAMDNLR